MKNNQNCIGPETVPWIKHNVYGFRSTSPGTRIYWRNSLSAGSGLFDHIYSVYYIKNLWNVHTELYLHHMKYVGISNNSKYIHTNVQNVFEYLLGSKVVTVCIFWKKEGENIIWDLHIHRRSYRNVKRTTNMYVYSHKLNSLDYPCLKIRNVFTK